MPLAWRSGPERSGISEGIYRYGKIPVYTGIYPGPFSHTGYFAFGRPVDGYAAAAGLGRGEPESQTAAFAKMAVDILGAVTHACAVERINKSQGMVHSERVQRVHRV